MTKNTPIPSLLAEGYKPTVAKGYIPGKVVDGIAQDGFTPTAQVATQAPKTIRNQPSSVRPAPKKEG